MTALQVHRPKLTPRHSSDAIVLVEQMHMAVRLSEGEDASTSILISGPQPFRSIIITAAVQFSSRFFSDARVDLRVEQASR
eukprot:891339-Rhodomonas_salina.1